MYNKQDLNQTQDPKVGYKDRDPKLMVRKKHIQNKARSKKHDPTIRFKDPDPKL